MARTSGWKWRGARAAGALGPLALLIAAPVVLALALGACRRAPDGEAPGVGATAVSADARYVGDAACAACHADIAASYERTGMGRSLSRFDPATAPERLPSPRVESRADGFVYDAFVRNDSLVQRERRYGPRGDVVHERAYAVAYVIGSGHATRSYLMDVGGHLTEMPLTWYAERAVWDLSPSYEQRNLRFERPITDACLSCHTGPTQHSAFTQGHFEGDIPLGITCERCHGPAGAHVEAHLAGLDDAGGEGDPTIVNPARLDRGRQLAVCQQCHLSGTAVFREGESPSTFRPGQHLSENRVVFAAAEELGDASAFGISSHAQRLALSACFKESAMTCTTCHDPHQSVAETGAAVFNDACRACHTPGPPRAPGAHPAASAAASAQPASELVCTETHAAAMPTANCVSCHLQAGGTSDIPHVTFTDHWIRRTLPPPRPATAAAGPAVRRAPFRLVPVPGVGETAPREPALGALEEAAATFEFYETTHRVPEYVTRVKAGARAGLAGGADLAQARLALGRALMIEDSLAAAEVVFRDAAGRFPAHARLHYWHGVTLRRLGRPADAAGPLERAAALQPHFVEARTALAAALADAGRVADAEAAYRAALARDPLRHASAWNDLGFLLLRANRVPEAAGPLERALHLDPDLPEALVNLGSLRLAEGRPVLADTLFARALRHQPANVAALANRGVIAAQAGRYEEARAYFRRVVALSPTDARARAMLAQLDAMGR